MFLSISFVNTPPKVSIPRLKGVTSSNSISFTSPAKMPPWIEAPVATHSIGSMPLSAFLPIKSSTNFLMIGILVGPPTNIILSMSFGLSLESLIACSKGCLHLCINGSTSCSTLALVSFMLKCFGLPSTDVMNGRLISVSKTAESSIFAFSAASLNLCIAVSSSLKSTPSLFLKSAMINFIKFSSISVPPSWVSPLVALTSNTPSE